MFATDCTDFHRPTKNQFLCSLKFIPAILFAQFSFAQNFQFLNIDEGEKETLEYHHSSEEAEDGCKPCFDTIRPIPFVKQVHDIGLMFPTWRPVVGYDSVSVLEGMIEEELGRPSVSAGDLPVYHYTHDITWNLNPDKNYRHFLSYDIIKKPDGTIDTVRNTTIHIEWETGLAQSNKGNMCTELNRQGKSCGFYSAGHERGDVIWNWPTLGDWVHVEGLRVWDRGHPPAGTEIHPARLIATRRNLPARINMDSTNKYATRIDIFASGDGGAFDNNRTNQPNFVRKVKMSSKDYVFIVKQTLPKPSATALLKYAVKDRKGNSFTASATYTTNSKEGTITIKIPWKSASVSDEAIFAQSVYLYWDEGTGVPADYKIDEVTVTLNELRFDRFHEALGKAEIRVFLDIGGNYLFLNEFANVADIMNDGLGKTRRKNWNFNIPFTVYVPHDKKFRVAAHGFEADGIDKLFGHIVDNYSPCTPATKKMINNMMIDLAPVGIGGCLDDPLGNAIRFHTATEFPGKYMDFVVRSDGGYHEDGCPCASFSPKNIMSIGYRVEKTIP
ncbi:MAG: hypothetical protein POELPBGB_01483 [Bacteroidia bacterium]|nr:hypothetical protein [Bacteroidia bacterium]